MSSETIRVGVVGAGGNTKLHHIPKLQAIEGVEIVSVCNRTRESAQRVADEFGIPTVYSSWKELIAADEEASFTERSSLEQHRKALDLGLAPGSDGQVTLADVAPVVACSGPFGPCSPRP